MSAVATSPTAGTGRRFPVPADAPDRGGGGPGFGLLPLYGEPALTTGRCGRGRGRRCHTVRLPRGVAWFPRVPRGRNFRLA